MTDGERRSVRREFAKYKREVIEAARTVEACVSVVSDNPDPLAVEFAMGQIAGVLEFLKTDRRPAIES